MDCLAKHTDDLWHLASVESVDEKNIVVQFKKFNLTCALDWPSVLLNDNPANSDSDTDDSEDETSGS